jgi:hypothetical protein
VWPACATTSAKPAPVTAIRASVRFIKKSVAAAV